MLMIVLTDDKYKIKTLSTSGVRSIHEIKLFLYRKKLSMNVKKAKVIQKKKESVL